MNIYVYIAFYVVMFLLALLAIKLDNKKRNYIFVLICICFAIFYGFRDGTVGFDTETYTRYYNSQDAKSYVSVERIFYFLSALCWNLHIPTKLYIAILTLCAILLNATAYFLMHKRDNKYLCLSYVCMFCLPYAIMMHINVVRQGIAISALLLAVVLMDLGHKKKAFILAIVGCLFHYMGFLLLAAYIFMLIFKKRKTVLTAGVGLSFMGLIVGVAGIGTMILEIIPNNKITKRVLCYLDEGITMSEIVKLGFYMVISLYIIFIIIKFKLEITNVMRFFLAIFILTGVGVSCMTVSMRMSMSMDLLIPLVLLNPDILASVEGNGVALKKKIYVGVNILFFVGMYVFGILFDPVKVNMGF